MTLAKIIQFLKNSSFKTGKKQPENAQNLKTIVSPE